MANVTRYKETAAGAFPAGETVTYQVYDNHNTALDGASGTATEIPIDDTTSIYYANVTWPDNWQGSIRWTDGVVTANETILEGIDSGTQPPASAPTGYPQEGDLESFLTGMGFTIPSGIDLSAAAVAAANAWEEDTRLIPFVGTTATRFFDPPGPRAEYGGWRGGERILQLYAGLLSVTSLSIGLTADDPVGQVLTEGVDFWLRPDNADIKGQPFTAIEFRVHYYGEIGSVKIVGVWGAMQTLTQQIWNAVLRRAAIEVFPELQYSRNAGAQSVKQGPVEYKYDPRLLMATPDAWERLYWGVVDKYRLRSLA